jgi:Leucine-rich repeat (LRR) protein
MNRDLFLLLLSLPFFNSQYILGAANSLEDDVQEDTIEQIIARHTAQQSTSSSSQPTSASSISGSTDNPKKHERSTHDETNEATKRQRGTLNEQFEPLLRSFNNGAENEDLETVITAYQTAKNAGASTEQLQLFKNSPIFKIFLRTMINEQNYPAIKFFVQERFTDYTSAEGQAIKKLFVLLKSADGAFVTAFRPIVSRHSQTLNTMLNDPSLVSLLSTEDLEQPIELPLSGAALKTIYSIMEKAYNIGHDPLNAARINRLTAEDNRVLPSAAMDFLQSLFDGISFLDASQPIIDAVALKVIKLYQMGSYYNPPSELSDNAKSAIGRMLYLISPDERTIPQMFLWKNLAYKFGVSIQDLINWEKIPKASGNILNLRDRHINDLDGLHNIPEINNVAKIDLSNNQLRFIQPGTFTKPNTFRLGSLDLSNNQLTSIEPGTFSGLDKLSSLKLKGNLITLQPDMFMDFVRSNLQWLNLSNNKLDAIPAGTFNGLSKLVSLSLDNNQLTLTTPDSFMGLDNLARLYLINNPIGEKPINLEAFRGLKDIYDLYAKGTNISIAQAKKIRKYLKETYNRRGYLRINFKDEYIPNM